MNFKKLSYGVYFMISFGLMISCNSKKTSKQVYLFASKESLIDRFPFYKKVHYNGDYDVLQRDCPRIESDSSYLTLEVCLSTRVTLSEIAFLRLNVSKILEINNIDSAENDSSEWVPTKTIRRLVFIDSLYVPKRNCSLIKFPNVFIEPGDYIIRYGAYLKADSINENIREYNINCKYRFLEDRDRYIKCVKAKKHEA